ncbi:MAG TPA: hypothetical protein VK003_04830, partial [Oceanobacillus sp.]|nr:hypothetical protein [Oceanobacillus sp.]
MATITLLQKRSTILGIAGILVIVLTIVFWQYTQDDVFITYTYSRNIAQGVGFVFNPGEYVQGTTTPLWALTMAGVYMLTPDLLHAGNFLCGLLLIVSCVLAYLLLRRYLSRLAILAATVLLATSPLNYASFGMETLLYCAILFAAFWLWSVERRVYAMLTAAALTWTRADGVVLGGTLCLIALLDDTPFSRRLLTAIKLGLVYVVGIAPWFLFAWAYFGAPLPNTFGAKQEFLQGIKFLADGVDRWRTFFGSNPISVLAVVFIPIGMWQAWKRAALRPLAAWALLYALGYTALNVTNFWYYTPLVNALILLAVIGAEAIMRFLVRQYSRMWVAAGLITLVLAVIMNVDRALQLSPPPPRMNTYRLAGEWIAEHTPRDSTLLLADLGIVGYYAQRHAIDSFGLIVPDMFFKTPEYATLKYKPDYILATQYFLWRYTTEEWFNSLYQPIVQFSTEGDAEFSPMTLYRRRGELMPPATVLEGTYLPLTFALNFNGGEVVPAECYVLLEADEALIEVTQPFLNGRYPAPNALENEVLFEQVILPLPVEPGRYRWRVAAPMEIEGTVEVLPITAAQGYFPVGTEWEDFASLNGVTLLEDETWSGGSLDILLEWRGIEEVDHDYTVFVHLLNANGELVAQHDGMPERPTSNWKAGERVIDEHEIILPPELPAGEYSLRVGWYDWQT